jgi:hypothetical protein
MASAAAAGLAQAVRGAGVGALSKSACRTFPLPPGWPIGLTARYGEVERGEGIDQ